MASDPERPIEKLLRASAEKRRDEAGAPFELHPATRRLLQGEVSRRFSKPAGQAEPAGGRLRRWWPRLAWGLAGGAAVAAVALLLIPARVQKQELLAKNDSSVTPAPATESLAGAPAERAPAEAPASPLAWRADSQPPAAPPPAAAPPQLQVASAESSAQAPAQFARRAESAAGREALGSANVNAPAAAAPPTTSDSSVASAAGQALPERELALAKHKTELAAAPAANQELAMRYGLRAPALTPAPVAPTTSAAPLEQRLHFVQAEVRAKAVLTDSLSPSQPVLASFQIEPSSSGLRIIDGDGSVYAGYLQPAENAASLAAGKALNRASPGATKFAEGREGPAAMPAVPAGAQGWSNYFFRVVGTNQTLNQRVVFTGNLVCPADFPMPASGNAGVGGTVGALQAIVATNGVPLVNARISGRAVLEDRREIQVNAQSSKP